MLKSQPALSVELIVNKDNPIESITLNNLRFIFLMRNTSWENGEKIKVYVNQWDSPEHTLFCKEILNVIPHRINGAWERKKYSGMGDIPETLNNDETMLNKIMEHKNAIGYVKEIPEKFKKFIKTIEIK